ncbi:MAG: threonine ammonia-lyase [Geminicoccaceae bacterium]|nr:threonine ammonia-lyase [Geminicoccaceae bacterium]
MIPVDIDDIRAAAARMDGHVVKTPMLPSRTLADITGTGELWLKFENRQYTASFKERGALNRLLALSGEERRRGVIAMSAGNHAQGVAFHGSRLGIDTTIVMPEATPFVKVDNTERLGAKVVLFGDTVDDAATHALELATRDGLVFIHPFDDPLIIAGQGTIGLEMLEAAPDLDALVIPIGGGGLVSGIAIAARAIRPETEIVGVEAELYPAMLQTLRGEAVKAGGSTVADGIAVKRPGRLTLSIIRELVDHIQLVNEAAIERAILDLLEIEKTVAEGAGAAGLAALIADPDRFAGKKVGLVISGGNIDSRLMSAVIIRGLVRTARLVRFAIAVPDSPGSLAAIARTIAEARGNVVDVAHHRAFSGHSVREAVVDFTLETRNEAHARAISRHIEQNGFAIVGRKQIDE